MIGGTNRRHQDTGGEGGREYLRNCCTKPRSDFLFTKHALFLGLEGPPHFRWDTLLGVRKVRIFHALHRLLVADWQSSCRRVICQCVFFDARWSISTSEDAIFHSRIENISLSDHEPRLVSESSSVDCDFNQDDDDYGEMAEGNTKSLHFN